MLIGPLDGSTQEGRRGPGTLTPALATRPRVTLAAIFRAYLGVGLTAFGMAVLQELGSVAEGVVRRASVPVLLLRASGHASPSA